MSSMAEINIRELSIGDWVRHTFYEENLQIKRIDGESERLLVEKGLMSVSCHLDHFEPIPLTPEILEKNGWSKEYDDVWECGVWRISQINKCLFVLYNKKYDYDFCAYIDTVHQLQHALRLAGVEKEIVL